MTHSTPFDWGEELPLLRGKRIRLRTLKSRDATDVFAVFGDPEVIRYWSSPALKNVDEAQERIQSIRDCFDRRELFQWGICSNQDDAVIGTCTLTHVDRTHRRAELGIALGKRAWGVGYATEALGVLIDFAFGELQLHRLEADVDPKNERSLALFSGLGFQREGYLRERWHLFGNIQDTVLLGLLAREWRASPSE